MKDEENIKEYDTNATWNTDEEYYAIRRSAKKKRALVLLFAFLVTGGLLGALLGTEGIAASSARSIQSPGEDNPTAAPEVVGGEFMVVDGEDPEADVDFESLKAGFNDTLFYSEIMLHEATPEWNATMFMESDGEYNEIDLMADGFEVRRADSGRRLQDGSNTFTSVYSGTYTQQSAMSIAFEIPVEIFADVATSDVWVASTGDRVPDDGSAAFELEFATMSPTAPGETRAPSAPAGTVSPGTPTMAPTETAPTGTVSPGTPTVAPTRAPTAPPTRTPSMTPTFMGETRAPSAPTPTGTAPTGTVSPGTPTLSPTAMGETPTGTAPTGTVSPGTPTLSPTAMGETPTGTAPTGTVSPGTPTLSPTAMGETPTGTAPTGTVSPGTPTLSPTAMGETPTGTAPTGTVSPGTTTLSPTAAGVVATAAPTTPSPTAAPTTPSPTKAPTTSPTKAPTMTPTTPAPTGQPSVSPTDLPTRTPTISPTMFPTSVDQTAEKCIRATDSCGDATNGVADWEELSCSSSAVSLICTLKACNSVFADASAVAEVYFNGGRNMVQVFTTFVLWNDIDENGTPVQLTSGEFNLTEDRKEYRFVFSIGSDEITDDAGVYVVARQFNGASVYDRFPNNNDLSFSPSQC